MVQQRDIRLDLLRGIALLSLAIDHVPANFFSAFTLRNFMLSDAAEMFVLISGISAALGFGGVLVRSGYLEWLRRIGRRIIRLYVSHIGLLALAAALLWIGIFFGDGPYRWSDTPFAAAVDAGPVSLAGMGLLQVQPDLLNILPLYVVLLAVFPLVYLMATWSREMVIVISGAVWLWASQAGPVEGAVWYFNPLAWQFLFVIGVVCGLGMSRGERVPVSSFLLVIAVVYLVVGLALKAPWSQIAGLGGWRVVPAGWVGPMGKTNLIAWRLGSILAGAYVWVYFVGPGAGWLRHWALHFVALLGRHGLVIFCAATAIDYLAIVARLSGARGLGYQISFNVMAVVGLCVVAIVAESYARRGRDTAVMRWRNWVTA